MRELQKPTMESSYNDDDVVFVLKDIKGLIKEQSTAEREFAIQSGTHYSEMLPIEYVPSADYMELFNKSLMKDASKVAMLVGIISELALKEKGKELTIVSLARAGTPIGVLMFRYILERYNIRIPHFSVSIIRDKGIDENALHYILSKHKDESILFVDGWTGKGAISNSLKEAITGFNERHNINISADLAVLADPGCCAELSATKEDFLIPSACLNSTISGLVSRTFHRTDIIEATDYHGAIFYRDLLEEDLSLVYIETVAQYFKSVIEKIDAALKTGTGFIDRQPSWEGLKSVQRIAKKFDITNINYVKPGIGETTRVLLRRVPWKILVHPDQLHLLDHVLQLAEEKNVVIEEFQDMTYSCCGIIKEVVK